MRDLSELRLRVEQATGPDSDLDRAIFDALGFKIVDHRSPIWPAFWTVKKFGGARNLTASIDAALGLVERELPGQWFIILERAMSNLELRTGRVPLQFKIDELIREVLAALLAAKEVEER